MIPYSLSQERTLTRALLLEMINSLGLFLFSFLGSIIVDSLGVCCDAGCRKFDNARKSNGGKYPDDFVTGVIAVLRVIPVFLLIILYWAIYSQVKQK